MITVKLITIPNVPWNLVLVLAECREWKSSVRAETNVFNSSLPQSTKKINKRAIKQLFLPWLEREIILYFIYFLMC